VFLPGAKLQIPAAAYSTTDSFDSVRQSATQHSHNIANSSCKSNLAD